MGCIRSKPTNKIIDDNINIILNNYSNYFMTEISQYIVCNKKLTIVYKNDLVNYSINSKNTNPNYHIIIVKCTGNLTKLNNNTYLDILSNTQMNCFGYIGLHNFHNNIGNYICTYLHNKYVIIVNNISFVKNSFSVEYLNISTNELNYITGRISVCDYKEIGSKPEINNNILTFDIGIYINFDLMQ